MARSQRGSRGAMQHVQRFAQVGELYTWKVVTRHADPEIVAAVRVAMEEFELLLADVGRQAKIPTTPLYKWASAMCEYEGHSDKIDAAMRDWLDCLAQIKDSQQARLAATLLLANLGYSINIAHKQPLLMISFSSSCSQVNCVPDAFQSSRDPCTGSQYRRRRRNGNASQY